MIISENDNAILMRKYLPTRDSLFTFFPRDSRDGNVNHSALETAFPRLVQQSNKHSMAETLTQNGAR